MDGTGVPTVPADTAGRAGKYPDGRARTREGKLGGLFTQTSVDQDGYPVRDPGSSSYVATLQAAPWSTPRPAGAAPWRPTSSSCSATAHRGSGTSPTSTSPVRPRSSISTTPASTATPLAPWSLRCSDRTARAGWPNDSPTSTAATSQPS